mgnify:CR=1 FL=1
MKTTLMFWIIFCLITCLGCSKESEILCGKIIEITWSWSGYSNDTLYHLTVELSDGSIRYDTVKIDSFEVGDEYCNATKTTND